MEGEVLSLVKQRWTLHPFSDVVQSFPDGSVVKNLPADAGDTGLIPGLGGSHVPQNYSP